MAKYAICIIQPRKNQGFFTTTFWLEVITLQATGELATSFKSQIFKNKNLLAWDSPGWRFPSEDYGRTQERIKSSLVAEGWHPVTLKHIDYTEGHDKTGEFFYRRLSTTKPQDKTPLELLTVLNARIQQGNIEMDLGVLFRDALLYVTKNETNKVDSESSQGIVEKLERLATLLREGALTQVEYEAAKRKLLEG